MKHPYKPQTYSLLTEKYYYECFFNKDGKTVTLTTCDHLYTTLRIETWQRCPSLKSMNYVIVLEGAVTADDLGIKWKPKSFKKLTNGKYLNTLKGG